MMLPFLAGVILTTETFPLTVESIMRGYALVGHSPSSLKWSEDGTEIGFQWAKAEEGKSATTKSYVVHKDGKGLKEGSVPTVEPKPWIRGSKVGLKIAYETGGDIWLRDTEKETSENLTNTTEYEMNPVLCHDGQSILFTKLNELYRLNLEDKKVTQLSQAKTATVAGVAITVDASEGFHRGGMTASSSGSHVAIAFFDSPMAAKNAQVARFITQSGFVELSPTYSKVGSPQGHSMIKIYGLKSGVSFDLQTPRPGSFGQMQWSPDGKHGAVWAFSEDHKDAWLYGFNTQTETLTTLWDEHDTAWVGGPLSGLLGWLPDSSKIYFGSENSGYANLKEIDPDTQMDETIVGGTFEVSRVQLDEDRNRFTFVSSEGSPYDRHIDSVDLKGGNKQKLADFSAGDDASYAFSPDGKDLAVVKSTSNRPAELFVNKLQVTQTPTDAWLAGPWIDPPIVNVPSRDGTTQIPAKLFKPKKWRRGGPAVVFVHGAGYLQNVFHGWSYYFREYMFHHLLMDKGYAVLDIDYRASAGYGKAWRTAIYRHMGGKDLEDVVDGAKYLVKELGAAPDRLGVYGGSYGGFITLMAMFTDPDVFKSGAALRPVGDWANYHHGYTSPILNTPESDPEAYKISSPINFVEGLKGNLLICHGMVDVNVQFQDSIRIVQRLIELGKLNWSVAPYPVEDHSFVRPESWTDEYRRIFDLFEHTIGTQRKK